MSTNNQNQHQIFPYQLSPPMSERTVSTANGSFFEGFDFSIPGNFSQESATWNVVADNDEENNWFFIKTTKSKINVPFSGNDIRKQPWFSAPKNGKQIKWYFLYSYGVWIDGNIYCTVSRRDVSGCLIIYSSPSKTTSNFTKHLTLAHGITRERHEVAMALVEQNINNETIENNEEAIHNFIINTYKNDFAILDANVLKKTESSQDSQSNKLFFTREIFYKKLDSQPLQDLLYLCNSSGEARERKIMELPTRNTIKNIILNYFEAKKQKVKKMLQSQEFLCFTTDGWKSKNGDDFMGITCHYIDKKTWQPVQVVIGFECISQYSHTGEYLAQKFISVLDDYGITSLLFTITTDNAFDMTKIGKEIEIISQSRIDFKFDASKQLIPCLAHVLNIGCQDLLKKGLKSSAPNSSTNDIYGISQSLELQDKGQEMRNEKSLSPVNKIRRGCIKIKSSSKMESVYKTIRDSYALPKLSLKYDCQTRWGSTYEMIHRYQLVSKAYNTVLAQEVNSKNLYILLKEEDEHVKDICELLQVFYTLTTWLCTQKFTTINRAIVLFDVVLFTLDTYITNNKCPEIVNACKLAKNKLEKYFSNVNTNTVYTCAMLLDPMLKIRWWKEEIGLDENDIQDKKEAVNDYWRKFLKEYYSRSASGSTDNTGKNDDSLTHESINVNTPSASDSSAMKKLSERKFISRKRNHDPSIASPSSSDSAQKKIHTLTVDEKITVNKELEIYLEEMAIPMQTIPEQKFYFDTDSNESTDITNSSNDEGEELLENGYSSDIQLDKQENISYKNNTVVNDSITLSMEDLNFGLQYAVSPLLYWKNNQSRFPALSEMARKYLSVCSTSVPSERLFSKAQKISNTSNAKMIPENVKVNVIMACWIHEIAD